MSRAKSKRLAFGWIPCPRYVDPDVLETVLMNQINLLKILEKDHNLLTEDERKQKEDYIRLSEIMGPLFSHLEDD